VNKKQIAAALGTAFYEIGNAKFWSDVHNVLSNEYVRDAVYKLGRIPERASLIPPYSNVGSGPFDINSTRPLELGEKIVATIYQNPILLVPILAAPAVVYAAKKGVDHYRKKK